MATKPKFSTAPKPANLSPKQADYIEKGRGKDRPKAADEPTQRLSLDLPKSLHKRFKAACALGDTKMTTEILHFIEKRTEELSSNPS